MVERTRVSLHCAQRRTICDSQSGTGRGGDSLGAADLPRRGCGRFLDSFERKRICSGNPARHLERKRHGIKLGKLPQLKAPARTISNNSMIEVSSAKMRL